VEVARFLQAFILETKTQLDALPDYSNREVKSIYFGGGTPSLLPVRKMAFFSFFNMWEHLH